MQPPPNPHFDRNSEVRFYRQLVNLKSWQIRGGYLDEFAPYSGNLQSQFIAQQSQIPGRKRVTLQSADAAEFGKILKILSDSIF
jgi:hypothetical protein